jgi:hypothetical protein
VPQNALESMLALFGEKVIIEGVKAIDGLRN